jgi:PAS domain S-box-containing protein
VNNNGRITIWNQMAEKISGYKRKEVFNRTISKLQTFSDAQQLEDAMKDISNGKKTKFDSVIISKDNAKKIIRLQGSLLKGSGNNKIGIIFIGEDITRDAEMHGKLLEGNTYLIPSKQIDPAVNLFVDLIGGAHQGLFISRLNPESLNSLLPSTSNIQIKLMSEERLSNYPNISDLDSLISSVRDFSKNNNSSIILLDGTHYLLTKYSFDTFISAMYTLNEIIMNNKSMMFVRFDPGILNDYQLAVVENELQALPSQKIKGITLEDSVYEILKFIYQQNQNNALVPFKKVMSKFKISYSTAAKRLEGVEEKGLSFTRRQGKLRAIYISEKGKTLLHKREIAE